MSEPSASVHAAPPPHQVAWLMDRSTEVAMLTDPGGRIEYVNPAFEALTGWRRDEVVGRTPALLKSGLHPPEVYQRLWRTLAEGQEYRGVMLNRRRDGALYHEEKSIRPLFDAAGRVTHLLSCGRDVSARVATMARLRHAAAHDALTGLPNRATLMSRLESAVARLRQTGSGFAVALVDVDDFKRINDGHGHAAGDAVLQALALRMRERVRKADTVARLGGDEFALLLEGLDDEREASRLLGGIAQALSRPVPFEGRQLPVSASVGGCLVAPGDGADAGVRQLLDLADAAMYQSKRERTGAGAGWRLVRADRDTASAPLPAVAPAADALQAAPAVEARPRWRSRRLCAGEVLIRAGQRLTDVFVLRRGRALVVAAPGGDGRVPVSNRTCGDWLGLDGVASRRHSCDVFMQTEAELWVVDYDELVAASLGQPSWQHLLLDALAREVGR